MIISLAEEDERYIILPRGCREALEMLLAEQSSKLTVLRIEDEVLAGELSESVDGMKI